MANLAVRCVGENCGAVWLVAVLGSEPLRRGGPRRSGALSSRRADGAGSPRLGGRWRLAMGPTGGGDLRGRHTGLVFAGCARRHPGHTRHPHLTRRRGAVGLLAVMPYKSPGARRTANREAQRRSRAGQAAEVAADASRKLRRRFSARAAVARCAGSSPLSGASVHGPGDGGRIGPGPPHNDLTAVQWRDRGRAGAASRR